LLEVTVSVRQKLAPPPATETNKTQPPVHCAERTDPEFVLQLPTYTSYDFFSNISGRNGLKS
jgi:hypothetical protein